MESSYFCIMMNHITDIFFDLDHTLWDFERNSALAFEHILAKHGIRADLQQFLSHYIPLNFAYWEKYRNDQITQEELRYRRLRDTFELLQIEVSDETINTLSDDYIHFLPQFGHLFEDAIDILNYLQSRNYRLHIITNGFHEVQHRKMESSGIAHFFTTVTNSESAGVKKPNPLIFEHALKTSGACRSTSLMIGDCIDADVRGALNCGIDAILYGGSCEDKSIKKINTLSELKTYL